jgi:glucosamine-6-phosphate deaminase
MNQVQKPTVDPHALDEVCLRQQVGEGWFADISEVPLRAISMSVKQILKAKEIICVVPDARRVRPSSYASEREVSPTAPASILRTHPSAPIYLDTESVSLLCPATPSAFAATS